MQKLKITDVPSLKKWLAMYRNLRGELRCQSERLSMLEEKMGTVNSPSFNGMPSNPSPTNDRRADMIASILDLQKDVNELYDYYENFTKDIEWCIRYMQVPEERAVIRTRYIDELEWKDITRILFNKRPDYEEKIDTYQRVTFRIHGTALKNLAEVASEELK